MVKVVPILATVPTHLERLLRHLCFQQPSLGNVGTCGCQPMMKMMEDDKKDDDKSKKTKEPRYLEDDDTTPVACCGSFTYKCSATFIGIILCVEFIILLIELYLIATNDYFELMFSAFYALFLIPILVTVVVFIIWLCDTSDIEFRKWLPGALWVAVVGNFVLIGWIIIYLLAIYDNENEYVIV